MNGANTLQTLKDIFKEIYNEKPVDAIKSTVNEGRRFKRIKRLLDQAKKDKGIYTNRGNGNA